MLDIEEIRLVSAFDVSICGALWRQIQRYKRYNLVVSAAHVKWSRVMLQKILHLSSKFSSIVNLIYIVLVPVIVILFSANLVGEPCHRL